ncbi:HNH endonuclease [Paraburkholderia tropica]|uniref:HNH endonuclease n=1 Tax=Paraburkholderia tropica TaxID=92647 RepID=UPI002AB762F8|nr:AP2 domain-containing protein [Paraburkholderia tropica]
MREIALTSGSITLVDDDMHHELSKFNWYEDSSGYAYRKVKFKNPDGIQRYRDVMIHRAIMGVAFGDKSHIDHIDGNKLNNQRSNLRICNSSQNQCNRGQQSNNTHGFKGVRYRRRDNKWAAQICFRGKKEQIGIYATAEDAHIAYCLRSVELHGEFAHSSVKEVASSCMNPPVAFKKENSTGFPGVYKRRGYEKWNAHFQSNKKRVFLGTFNSPEEAYAAYLEAAQRADEEHP